LIALQHASLASKILSFQHPHSSPSASSTPSAEAKKYANTHLPVPTLLYLATLGGASLCNLSSTIGNFVPGKEFDALLVTLKPETGNPAVWWNNGDALEAMLERFFFGGDDRNISGVWVRGRPVSGSVRR
jgi:guanine deaminase